MRTHRQLTHGTRSSRPSMATGMWRTAAAHKWKCCRRASAYFGTSRPEPDHSAGLLASLPWHLDHSCNHNAAAPHGVRAVRPPPFGPHLPPDWSALSGSCGVAPFSTVLLHRNVGAILPNLVGLFRVPAPRDDVVSRSEVRRDLQRRQVVQRRSRSGPAARQAGDVRRAAGRDAGVP